MISFLLFGGFVIPLSLTQTINKDFEAFSFFEEGQFLYSPLWSKSTYLRESSGQLNHTWYSNYLPGASVWWIGDENWTIMRTIRVGIGPGSGGKGGGVQKVEWDGTVIWDFRYNTNGVMSHHDIFMLPNGNVFLIAWETKTRSEAIAAGRNPNTLSEKGLWPDHIIEVEPTGPTSGDIVWEWHAWDHLIQDYDPSKDNYGIISEHPELIDINYDTTTEADFMHSNSVDYNENLDQILLSVLNYNEIWIIDHSTTTEEAAGHTGGNSGKGGDILYRWGNPKAYDRGNSDDQKFSYQHDARWIIEGYPGEGNILVFNNGINRHYSSVDEIIPPVNEDGEYYLENNEAYGPENHTWSYTANPPTSFYEDHLGGAHRLRSGNTLISSGVSGKVFEVTKEKNIVWEYNIGGQFFKAVYVSLVDEEPPVPNNPDLDCSGNLSWTNIKPGETVKGSFQVFNIGDPGSLLNWTIDASAIGWGTWFFTPVSDENLTPEDGEFTVQVSVVAPNNKGSEYNGYIRVENKNNPDDFDTIIVYLKTQRKFNKQFSFFSEKHPNTFQMLWLLIQKIVNK
ncbi:hypothetical protein AYK24_04495 [Thermoplasmatales archaeon SG8-52-4]|nr:MAG: hypothetical protein AYK24_04495 [Thermoplasmatales archaeon SG8-52-4]